MWEEIDGGQVGFVDRSGIGYSMNFDVWREVVRLGQKAKPPGSHAIRDQAVQSWFKHGGSAGAKVFDDFVIVVEANDFVSHRGKTCCRYGAEVPKTLHANSRHLASTTHWFFCKNSTVLTTPSRIEVLGVHPSDLIA